MRCATIMLICLVLFGCKLHPKTTNIHTPEIVVTHDSQVSSPPEIHVDRVEGNIPVPAGGKITVTETAPTETSPAVKETVIELPKSKGTEIKTINVRTDAVGSRGFEPEKGATPTEKANAWWVYIGIGIAALGAFFCTPWGGSNFRVGAILAACGVAMAVIGKFIDQIKIPAPSLFLFGILLAAGVYYGYRVRHKQISPEPTK